MEKKVKMALKKTVVVIRCWKNKEIFQRVRVFLEEIGVDKVIVVVNAIRDRGETSGYLKGYENDPRLKIIELEEGFNMYA